LGKNSDLLEIQTGAFPGNVKPFKTAKQKDCLLVAHFGCVIYNATSMINSANLRENWSY
jgi:hypothetical protein